MIETAHGTLPLDIPPETRVEDMRTGYTPDLPTGLSFVPGLSPERQEERDAIDAILWHTRNNRDIMALALDVLVMDVGEARNTATAAIAAAANLDETLADEYVRLESFSDMKLHVDDTDARVTADIEEKFKGLTRGIPGETGAEGPRGHVGFSGDASPEFKELEAKIADVIEMVEDALEDL